MEIKYSKFDANIKVFQKKEIYGLYDKNSNFVASRIQNIETIKYNEEREVSTFLFTISPKKHQLLKKIKNEFKIDKKLERKKLKELSTFELINILVAKLYISNVNLIILDNIDAFLTTADLKSILLYIKNTINIVDKTVVFVANRIDNMLPLTNNYVIASENRIIYNGNDIKAMHETTEIMKFVNTANEKGAKLNYYKDPKDLLKAIYRSVKK